MLLNAQDKKNSTAQFLTIANTVSFKVIADHRIDSFYRDLQILQIKNTFPQQIPAYQLQIVSTKNRLEAMRVKKDLEDVMSQMPNEIVFKEPYYKLRVGLYRTSDDAEVFRQKLNLFFDNKRAIVIIPNLMDTDAYLLTFFGKK